MISYVINNRALDYIYKDKEIISSFFPILYTIFEIVITMKTVTTLISSNLHYIKSGRVSVKIIFSQDLLS